MHQKKEKIKHPLVLNTYQDGMQGNNIIYEHKEITTRFVNKHKLKCKELRIKIRFKLSKSKGTPYIECTAIKYFPEGQTHQGRDNKPKFLQSCSKLYQYSIEKHN